MRGELAIFRPGQDLIRSCWSGATVWGQRAFLPSLPRGFLAAGVSLARVADDILRARALEGLGVGRGCPHCL